MSDPKLDDNFGYIITRKGVKIKYPKAFPLINTDEIKRHKTNVKIHNAAQINDISKLILLVGFKDPIVLDEKGVMWAGHGRLDAAELLEMPQIPWYPLGELTEKQKNIFMIMDNKVNESEWDFQNFETVFSKSDLKEIKDFEMNFDNLIDTNTKPKPEDWAEVFDNEDEVEKDSIQITFNIPIKQEDGFKKYLAKIHKSKDAALMEIYKFCKKNMK